MEQAQAYGILSVLAGASLVNAHGYVYSWTVNGEVHPGTAPGESSDGAARPTENTDWGKSLERIVVMPVLTIQDHPTGTLESSLAEARNPPQLRGSWMLEHL